MVVTLESLRAELQDFAQHAMRTELHSFRKSILEDMQKSMCSFKPAPMTCASQERAVSQCQSSEREATKELRQAATIYSDSVPKEQGWAVEAPALPRPFLEPMTEHGTMDDSGRLLYLHGEEHVQHKKHIHLHHGKEGKVDYDLQQKARDELTGWERVRVRMNDLVASDKFDMASGMVVILNAFYIGYQTDWVAKHWTDSVPAWFMVGDVAFCIITVLEVAIRIIALGGRFFYIEGCGWNWFDFVVASTQVLDVVMTLTANGDGGGKLASARMLKLARIFRIARIASVFPQLHIIISSIVDSLGSLFWTLVMIFAFLYGVAIALTQLVNDHKMLMGTEHMEAHEEEILELYGTLHKSMLSLYMVISEGIHWSELSDPLAENVSPWMNIVFVLFVGFMIFAMMNIITANFVDNAMKIAARAESDECLAQLWKMMEGNVGVGEHVTKDVFVSHFDQPGMSKFLELTDADGEDPEQIFGLIDESGDGKLDADEFVECCGRLMGGAKALQVKKDIFALRQDMTHQLGELKALQQKVTEQQATSQAVDAMESRLLLKIEGVASDAAAAVVASAKSDADNQKSRKSLGGMFSPR